MKQQTPHSNVTLRDQFAMSALATFPHLRIQNEPHEVALAIYRMAEAALYVRDATTPLKGGAA